jgi:pimeloyl-ACP methyl ester carboxylesterase
VPARAQEGTCTTSDGVAIARSTLRVVPVARHLTPIECPDPIAAALLDLLRGGG